MKPIYVWWVLVFIATGMDKIEIADSALNETTKCEHGLIAYRETIPAFLRLMIHQNFH